MRENQINFLRRDLDLRRNWVFDFLNSFVTNFGKPTFEWFGFGRGNGLDDTKNTFGVGTVG